MLCKVNFPKKKIVNNLKFKLMQKGKECKWKRQIRMLECNSLMIRKDKLNNKKRIDRNIKFLFLFKFDWKHVHFFWN